MLGIAFLHVGMLLISVTTTYLNSTATIVHDIIMSLSDLVVSMLPPYWFIVAVVFCQHILLPLQSVPTRFLYKHEVS